ncbi:MAG: phosphoenolpyruvate carboxylase [Paludibacter sp.]|nr:phosphoenolpyruvate carboxylase [Paludibacter sp.]
MSTISEKSILKSQIDKGSMQKIREDLHSLISNFKSVLFDLNEESVAQTLSLLEDSIAEHRHVETEIPDEKLIQALSILFQLMNLVEENAIVQSRRKLENLLGPAAIRGSWGETFEHWVSNGATESQIAGLLPSLQITPVLTAHPTEAKRISILELHRKLYLLLVKKENKIWTHFENTTIDSNIKVLLERWWRSGEVYLEKPSIASERNNVMHFFCKIFPDALKISDQRLKYVWESYGFDKNLLNKPEQFPRIKFGSWVGGDRDGHPYVTAEVTRQTLQEHRTAALDLIKNALVDLVRDFSFSESKNVIPATLSNAIDQYKIVFGVDAQRAIARNPREPWRQFLNLILLKLNNTIQDITENTDAYYRNSSALLNDLKVIEISLVEVGGQQIVDEWLFPVQRLVQCFGFHLAKLDIRQNSDFHNKAMEQMLKKAGFEDYEYSTWSEEKRIAFISNELKSNRPFVVNGEELENEAQQLVDCYKTIKTHVDKYCVEGIGSFIVSMTRGLSDILLVQLFLREVGLLQYPFQVVPLFETIDDLKISDKVLDDFLSHPASTRVRNSENKMQEVMLGYSDSNKDGGIMSSRWNIYETEIRLTEVANKHGISLRFFHGIGGTISRGGGKYHRFLQSMPYKTMSGEIKLTVQGEAIAQQFANPLNAVFNLEMLLAGTALQTEYKMLSKEPPAYPIKAVEKLSNISLAKYQELILHPDFIRFYSEVTPIDVLEQSKIGSRPARRTGKRSLADLRAIPWVFSWKQSRFNITGWYGIGTALRTLREEHPDMYAQIAAYAEEWPFLRYNLIQVETNLINSDYDMMHEYASLITDEKLRETMVSCILKEHQEGLTEIANLLGKNIETRRATLLYNVRSRKSPLDALHKLQIAKLKEWRQIRELDPEKGDQVLVQLLMITSAISGGLKATG